MSEWESQSRPVISLAVRPETDTDLISFIQALDDIGEEDPRVRINTQSEDGWTIISGMDELHLESVCNRILHHCNVRVDASGPKVIYLETVRKRAEAEGKYTRQTGGSGNYGHVKIRIEPNERGKGAEFINDIKDGVIPKEYIQPSEIGIREAMQGGILAGYELVDVKVSLFDGKLP